MMILLQRNDHQSIGLPTITSVDTSSPRLTSQSPHSFTSWKQKLVAVTGFRLFGTHVTDRQGPGSWQGLYSTEILPVRRVRNHPLSHKFQESRILRL